MGFNQNLNPDLNSGMGHRQLGTMRTQEQHPENRILRIRNRTLSCLPVIPPRSSPTTENRGLFRAYSQQFLGAHGISWAFGTPSAPSPKEFFTSTPGNTEQMNLDTEL